MCGFLVCTLLQLNTLLWDIVLDLTSLAYQPNSRERSAHPKKHVTFALSEQISAHPVHSPELDKDDDDKPLVTLMRVFMKMKIINLWYKMN